MVCYTKQDTALCSPFPDAVTCSVWHFLIVLEDLAVYEKQTPNHSFGVQGKCVSNLTGLNSEMPVEGLDCIWRMIKLKWSSANCCDSVQDLPWNFSVMPFCSISWNKVIINSHICLWYILWVPCSMGMYPQNVRSIIINRPHSTLLKYLGGFPSVLMRAEMCLNWAVWGRRSFLNYIFL